jgi:TP901 family phage tail tape measure protein
MSIDLKVGIDQKHWLREVERGRKMAQQALNKSGAELKLKINEKGFRQPLGRITGDLKQFDSALAASNARVIAFGASTAVIGGISKAFKELAKTTVEVGKAFADINRILQMSNKDLSKFGNDLFEIGKKNATAFQDTTKAALEFARQGLKTEETLKRTSDALTLVRLTGINADKAVSSLTATVNAFDNAMVTTTSSVNKFVAVETKFAVGARDLVEAIGRVGSSAKDAKVGFDELNAMVTAVQQTTGRGGAVIGNAMKTIFTRLQRQSTLEALEAYGVAVKDVEGATLPAIRILDNFAKSYKGLADQNQAYLREQVAGVFQANILSAILRDLNKQQSTFSQALKVSVNATNEADQATAQLNKTLSALTTQTGLEFKRLQENIGRATFEPIAKALLDPLSSMMKGLNDIIDGEGAGSEIANGLLKGIKNVIGGPGFVAIVGLIGKVFINTTSYLLKSLPALAGITTETQKRAQFEQIIETAMRSEAGLADMIAAEEGNAARQAGIFAAHAEAAKQDLDAQEKSIRNIAATLMRMPKGTQTTVLAAGGGKGAGRGASGFIPGVAGEAHDIARGVGGVSRSAKPVVIPNFAFGGGVRGTMIANTGEHIVPNFKGGGSAIFNPNMIAQYGMPAGAKPIRGAGGYVPNFVGGGDVNRAITTLKGLTGRRLTDAEKIEGDKAAAALGVPASLYPSAAKGSAKVALSRYEKDSAKRESQKAKMFDATSFADMLVPTRGHKSSKFLKFKSADKVKQYGAEGVIFNRRGIANNAENQLSNLVKIDEVLDDSIVSAANTVISSIHPEFVKKIPVSEQELQPFMSKEGAPGAIAALKGAFFEALIGRMVNDKNATPDGMTLDTVMSPAVKKLFVGGMKTSARFGDFKGSVSQGNDGKFAEQVLKNRGRAAGGYVPNFAALGDAVEREAAAGVPLGSIRVGRSSRLAGPNNPAGLAVTNTRDEPRGLKDVVGASKGYVPNYALNLPGGLTAKKGKGHAALIESLQKQLATELNDAINDYRKGNMSREQLNAKTKQLTQSMQLTNAAEKKVTAAVNRRAAAADRLAASRGGAVGIGGRMSALNARMSRGPMGGMGVGMGLTMGAPMLAGAIEQGFGEGNATGQVLSGALTGAGTGAAMGMMFGPLGAAIGGVGGALIGLGVSAMDAGKSLEQLERESKEYQQETDNNTNAAREYIQASRDLAAAISPEEFEDAQKRLAKNFDEIKDVNLQTAFSEAGTSVDEMVKKLEAYELRRESGAIGGRVATNIKRLQEEGGGIGTEKDANRILTRSIGPDGIRFDLDKTALSNLKKQYGDFFKLMGNLNEAQMKELSDLLAEEGGSGIMALFGEGRGDFAFDASAIADKLVGFRAGFDEKDAENLGNFFQRLQEVTDGRFFADEIQVNNQLTKQSFVGFAEVVKLVNDFQQTTKSLGDSSSALGKEIDFAQESFINAKSNITRLTESLGSMVKSLDNIAKVRKAFTTERIDLLSGAGRGLSIGSLAQGQASAGFADQRAKLIATTAQANSTRIMDAIKAGQSAAGDISIRKLEAAANLFSQDINAGLDAFAEFTSANSKEQEKLTKLINELRITYNDQLTNINLDEKITQAKLEVEQKRRENTERQAILTDAMSAMENRRAMNLVDENATRQRRINILQGSLEDPRNFRGTGLNTESRRIKARAAIQRQISDLEFEGRRAEATQSSVQKANALLVQKQQIALDNELLKSQNSLNDTMQELIFEFQKQSDLVAMGSRPNFTEADATRLGYANLKDARMAGADMFATPAQAAFDAKRKGILNRKMGGGASAIPESGSLPPVRVDNPLGERKFDYETEEKAAKNLAATLEDVKTQEEVITKLNERRAQLEDDQVGKAEKRRIDALLREINLGKKKLDTEQAISDELREQTNNRKISLDQDARSFRTQFTEGMLDIYEETEYIYGRLGRDLPTAFRDGMVNALEVSLDKAETFGDAMRGVAIDMLKMIRRASLEYSMSNFTNLLGMADSGFRNSQNGGIIKARNGMYISGNRTGDRNPALLEDGEYVLNRKAVRGMGGKAVLDSLNFGSFPRFANGGMMTLNESVKSDRMSGYFLASDNPELAEAREKAMEEYQKKQQKKAERKALKTQFLSTLMSVGISKGISAISGRIQEGQNAKQMEQMTAGTTNDAGESLALTRTGSFLKGYNIEGSDAALAQFKGQKFLTGVQATNLGLDPSMKHRVPKSFKRALNARIDARLENAFDEMSYLGTGPDARRNFFNIHGQAHAKGKGGGKISGGFINRDSVPAYMAGGEFVMNNRAVRKYGLGFMGRLNGGLIPTMQAGGMVGPQAAPLNNQTGANTNNISINVNVGGAGSNQGSDNTGNKNANEESNRDRATEGKELSERIRSAVLQVIQDEQRLGGSLSKTSRQG